MKKKKSSGRVKFWKKKISAYSISLMVYNLRLRYSRRTPVKRPSRFSRKKFAYVKAAVSQAGRLYRAYRAQPSRLRVSTRRFAQTSRVTKAIRNVSGSKYQGYTGDCINNVAKPAGTQPISYIFMNTGQSLTPMGGSLALYTPMDLFQYPQGTDNDERVGDYMYLRNTRVKLEIQALPKTDSSQQPVIQFRLLCIKANEKYQRYTTYSDPGDNLFLNTQNSVFGYGVPSGTPPTAPTFLNMDALVNKRNWIVYADKRFNLSAPVINDPSFDVNNANSQFKTKKYITLNLPSSKKVHFDNATNTPDDFDSQFLFILQAVNGSYCNAGTAAPRNYRMNVIGSTCAYDN